MGSLSGPRTIELRSRTLIGRSQRCEVLLAHHSTSAEHAVIWWDGDKWLLRDLDSLNGTFLNGTQVEARQEPELRPGDELRFGRGKDWTVAECEPALATAVSLTGSGIRQATALLPLPKEADVQATVFRDHLGRWQLESDEGARQVADLEEVAIAGQVFRLYLPEALERTTLEEACTLETATLRIAHTRDEEHVQVAIHSAGLQVDLGARAHHYLLLLLARVRLEDAEKGVPEDKRGWIHRDVLLDMLRVDRKALNLQVYRIRDAMSRAGVIDPGEVVERRRGNHQLRLGMERVQVSVL